MKATGISVFLVPINPADLKQKSEHSFGTLKRKDTREIRWRVASVGEGRFVATNSGVVNIPLMLKVGDVVICGRGDSVYREKWASEDEILNGAKGIFVGGWFPQSESGEICALVERDGKDVND
ncbi:MAG TPA: hypothetical protein VEJ39_02075 [Candidatus Acidoferrales bacterium]|nr:hypothetical protein [Candidatus Acidoferrales bacterium]